MLSLPIPLAQKDLRITIKYFPRSLLQRPREYQFQLNEYATLNEIRAKIIESHPTKEQPSDLFMTKIKNKCVNEILDKEKFVKTYIEKGDEICAYERVTLPENSGDNFFLLEVKIC